MNRDFTKDDSLQFILTEAGPEMRLYFPAGMLDFVPEKFRDRPMREWIDDLLMPWNQPLSADEILYNANQMVLHGDENRELIPLWAKNDFTVWTNDIHSVCLIRLKEEAEKNGLTGTDEVHPPVIVVPGGAYETIAFANEGFLTAKRLSAAGFRPFVLNYRYQPNRYPLPQIDLALAILHLRANAAKYRIDPDDLMILGYSAGGHLCASEPALRQEIHEALLRELRVKRPDLCEAYKDISIRPDKVCLGYPVISFLEEVHAGSVQALTGGDESLYAHLSVEKQVPADYPKTFVWTCADDSHVPPSNAVRMAEALKEKNVPVMLRVYPTGEHGCSTGDGTSAEGWMDEMFAFMKD